MSVAPYVRRRGGGHQLRIRIPNPLRAALGRSEVTRSLRAREPGIARRRGARAVAAIQAGYGILERLQANDANPDEQRELFERMVDRAMEDPHHLIAHEPALRDIDDPAELRARFVRILEGAQDRLEQRRAEHARAEAHARAEREARACAEQKARQAKDQVDVLKTSMAQLTASGLGELEDLADGHDQPVAALKDTFLTAKGLKPKTEKSYRKAFARFEAVVGEKPISEITKNDVVRFVENLEATRSDKRDRDPLDPATSKKYLSHIKTFFDEAKGKNRVRTNPAEGVTVTRKASRPEEERSPFTPTELQAILNTPLYRGCKSLSRIHEPGSTKCRDGRFWYGLVMVLAGARNGEIEALSVDDVVQHHGIWHIDVHKRTKKSASKRLVPIHSSLIRMGFLDWVAQRRRDASGGNLFEPRKYGRIWNEGVLPTAGVKRDDTVCYSFRHTFEDGLKELVQDETKRRLMGHAESRMGGRYGNGRITRTQAEAIKALDLGGIDLSFLYEYESVDAALAACRL